jgi:hypothetical protein
MKLSLGRCVLYEVEIERPLFRLIFRLLLFLRAQMRQTINSHIITGPRNVACEPMQPFVEP